MVRKANKAHQKTMKKIIGGISLLLLLSACADSEEDRVWEERFGTYGTSIITDSETGCKYLYKRSDQSGGLSPLYNENGELYCGE